MSDVVVESLSHEFVTGPALRRSRTLAVDEVSFSLGRGAAVALVGESGSGKTTLGNILVGLLQPTSGSVHLDGVDLQQVPRRDRLATRRKIQMVFQNSQGAFNPRRRVRQVLADPLRIHGLARGEELWKRGEELFASVGLDPSMLNRFPHEFSGGQRQRVNIARALALQPEFLVADEPVSALDVSVQAQILNLLGRLRSEENMGMLFISHDMRAVSFLCDRIIVMYRGRVVEMGDRDELSETPSHPYTRTLIDAVPKIDGGRGRLEQAPPPVSPPDLDQAGCHFRHRCILYESLGQPETCRVDRPVLEPVASGARVACHFRESSGSMPRGSSSQEEESACASV